MIQIRVLFPKQIELVKQMTIDYPEKSTPPLTLRGAGRRPGEQSISSPYRTPEPRTVLSREQMLAYVSNRTLKHEIFQGRDNHTLRSHSI